MNERGIGEKRTTSAFTRVLFALCLAGFTPRAANAEAPATPPVQDSRTESSTDPDLVPDYQQAVLVFSLPAIELYNKAIEESQKYNDEEAVRLYKKAIRRSPRFWMAYSNMGTALIDLGRLDEADRALRQALHINPSDGLTHMHRSRIARLRGDHRRALKLLQPCFQYQQTRETHEECTFKRAHLLERLERYREAHQLYEQLVKWRPQDLDSLFGRLVTSAFLNQPARARTEYEEWKSAVEQRAKLFGRRPEQVDRRWFEMREIFEAKRRTEGPGVAKWPASMPVPELTPEPRSSI